LGVGPAPYPGAIKRSPRPSPTAFDPFRLPCRRSGGLRGSLDGFASPAVEWGVRYANEAAESGGSGGGGGAASGSAGAKSVGVNLWLTSRLPVPHMTLYVGVRAGRATLMADHLPRFDLGERPEHVAAFYGGEQASRWSAAQRVEGLTPFRSSDPSVRALQGPNALALHGAAADPHAVSALVAELDRHAGTWLRWVRTTPLLDDGAEAEAVRARDWSLRAALRDHERAAGERFMGPDVAATLSASMAGPELRAGEGARAEPLAWRPAAAVEGVAKAAEEDLRRFGETAQRVVAGVPAAGSAEPGEHRSLSVEVTVHRDLGSFMAAKPGLEVLGDAGKPAVLVRAHAFAEPDWRSFDRPLANTPEGVYTYVHELADAASPTKSGPLAGPTICLKLKRREAVAAALGGTALDELAARHGDAPDLEAARRVNQLACRWQPPPSLCAALSTGERLRLELTGDRELLDDPDGPLGNKGGLYIESRVRVAPAEGNPSVLRVTSPTITTPLAGVPEQFRAGHYMKVLSPWAGYAEAIE